MKHFIAAAIFAASLLAQQRPAGPGPQPGAQPGLQQMPRVEEIKAFLGLSDAQIQKLRALEPQKRQQLQAIFREIGEKQKALHDQMESGSANATAAGTLLLEIENLHKKAHQLDVSLHDQAVKALDAGQAEKLKKLEEVSKFMQMLEEARRLGPMVGEAAGLQLVSAPPMMPAGPGPGQMGPRQGVMPQRMPGVNPRMGPAQGPMPPAGTPGPGPGGPPADEQ